MEARVGIEPTYKGFADLSLTTWVPRRTLHSKSSAGVCLEGVAAPWFTPGSANVGIFSRRDLCYNTRHEFDAQFGCRFFRFHRCARDHIDSARCSRESCPAESQAGCVLHLP